MSTTHLKKNDGTLVEASGTADGAIHIDAAADKPVHVRGGDDFGVSERLATAVKQDEQTVELQAANVSLDAIETSTANIDAGIPNALGKQAIAGSTSFTQATGDTFTVDTELSSTGNLATEAKQDTGNTSLASIDLKTPELWYGRISDGGIAIRDRKRIVSAGCLNSISNWKATTVTGGTFSYNSTILAGQLTVDGTSGASAFARSIQTMHSTPDRTQTEINFRFAPSHANLVQEVGLLACDVPMRGGLFAEQGGLFYLNVYASGSLVQSVPLTTVPYSLDGAFHTFASQTVGAGKSNGATRFFIDGVLILEAPPTATQLPVAASRGFDLVARLRCVAASIASTMYISDSVAYSFTDDAYPTAAFTATRSAPIAIAAAWYPLVAVRSSKLGAAARPTLWPISVNMFFSAGGASTGRLAVFHNRTGTTRLTGGAWTAAANEKYFDENTTATAFDATGLEAIGGEVPITTNGEGILIERSLEQFFRIGGPALCNWPDAGGSYEELVLCAWEDSGSITAQRASIIVKQPGRGP